MASIRSHPSVLNFISSSACSWLPLLIIVLSLFAPSLTRAASESYTWKHVRIGGGGFVTGIVCNPNFQNVIYNRTDTGGAYRWNNTSSLWEPLLDWANVGDYMGVESIAIDPADGNRVYLACGWSGAGAFSRILVSTDKGETFAQFTPPFGMGANNDGRSNGERMMVDPNNPAVLLFASRSQGLWKSTNRGQSWSQLTGFPVSTTANKVGPNLVLFDKASGTPGQTTPVIYVGVSQSGNNLYRSTNGGASWSVVNTGAAGSGMMPHRGAMDGVGNLYVSFADAPGPNNATRGAVLKFNLTNLAVSVVTPPTDGGGGFAGLSVSKQNPSTVVVSTIDRWSVGDRIYLSTNGGNSWTDTTANATVNYASAPWMTWHSSTPGFGHWIGDCQIDPFNANRMFYITGAGVMGTNNLLASSGRVYSAMSTGIEEMGAGNILAPPTGPILYSAFWDIGSFTHYNLDQTPPDANHFDPVGGSNVHLDYAELVPATVVRLGWSLTNYGAISTDTGKTWTSFSSFPASAPTSSLGRISISPKGTYLTWTPGNDNQYFSTNRGATWSKCSGGTTNGFGYAAVADRATDGTFYIYDAATSRFLRSTNGGQNFSVVNSSMVQWGGEPPAPVFGRAGDVWLPTWNGLYHSVDGGANWVQFLSGQDVTQIGFGKAAPGASYPTIYIWAKLTGATSYDVYRSTDAAASWVRINDDQHRWGWVGQIRGDQRIYGTVYVGCRNYGIVYGVPASSGGGGGGANGPIANGTYRILNRNSAKALDATGHGTIDGTQIEQWTYASGNNQRWVVTNLGNAQYSIVGVESGKSIDVNAGGTADGTKIQLFTPNGSSGQKWTFTATDSGNYRITPANAPGACLDVAARSTADGALVQLWTYNGGANQQWSFQAP